MLNLLLVTLGLAWLTELAGLSLRARRLHRRHADRRDRIQAPGRDRHPAVPRRAARACSSSPSACRSTWRSCSQHWPLVLRADRRCRCCSSSRWSTVLARALRRLARRRAAHRPLPRAGRRVRLRAAGAGDRARAACRRSLQSPVLASMVLSMLATPFIFMYSNRIVMRLSASDWLLQSVADDDDRRAAINTEAHVIICGYGRSGQNLARLLEAEKHRLHRAGPRPRPRAPGRGGRPERRVRRRCAPAEPDGRRAWRAPARWSSATTTRRRR